MSRRSALVQHSSPVALESIHLTKTTITANRHLAPAHQLTKVGRIQPTARKDSNSHSGRIFLCVTATNNPNSRKTIDRQEETRKLADQFDLPTASRPHTTHMSNMCAAPSTNRLLVVAIDAKKSTGCHKMNVLKKKTKTPTIESSQAENRRCR